MKDSLLKQEKNNLRIILVNEFLYSMGSSPGLVDYVLGKTLDLDSALLEVVILVGMWKSEFVSPEIA